MFWLFGGERIVRGVFAVSLLGFAEFRRGFHSLHAGIRENEGDGCFMRLSEIMLRGSLLVINQEGRIRIRWAGRKGKSTNQSEEEERVVEPSNNGVSAMRS